jgi:hypothetical protein
MAKQMVVVDLTTTERRVAGALYIGTPERMVVSFISALNAEGKAKLEAIAEKIGNKHPAEDVQVFRKLARRVSA